MKVRHAVATCLMGAVGATCLPAVAAANPAPPAALSTPAISSVATVAAPPTAAAALVPGASGGHIVALQRALIARGHAIPAGATGFFGSQTKSAVAAFQRAQGWRGSGADGVPGPQTLARLGLGTAAKPAPQPRTVRASTPVSSGSYAAGARGGHITALQQALISRGYRIPAGATGYFGSQTKSAVAAFQRAQGWRGSGADGIPGPKTLARLGLGSAAKPAPQPRTVRASTPVSSGSYAAGARGSHITALQQALISRGFRIPAGATGYFGSQTKSAVAAFQRAQGWRGSGADGIPGPKTLARLGGAATARAVAASSTPIPAPTGALSPATFVARYGPVARSAGAATGVPPLVTLAQAALESGWGRGAAGNNFFGVKARASDSAKQLRTTYEVLSSPNIRTFPQVISVSRRSDGLFSYTVRDWFRTYSSAEQAFIQHNQLLRSARYSGAFRYTADPYRFAAAVAAGGYATDPSYTSKLHAVMRTIERYGFR